MLWKYLCIQPHSLQVSLIFILWYLNIYSIEVLYSTKYLPLSFPENILSPNSNQAENFDVFRQYRSCFQPIPWSWTRDTIKLV